MDGYRETNWHKREKETRKEISNGNSLQKEEEGRVVEISPASIRSFEGPHNHTNGLGPFLPGAIL